MVVVFADLEDSSVDHARNSWEAARPAFERLRERKMRCVLVTARTRAEVLHWLGPAKITHPFVVENGAAAFIPRDYFNFVVPGAVPRDGFDVLEWGRPYVEVTTGLRAAARLSGCPVRGFHDLSPEQIAALCNLTVEEARVASAREYEEPFQVLNDDRAGALAATIHHLGFCSRRAGRFWRISGCHDSMHAVDELTKLYRRSLGRVETIIAGMTGPQSWDDAMLKLFPDLVQRCVQRERSSSGFFSSR